MRLQVLGAGLPRTGTSSLKLALEYLLGGRCYHMHEIPGHPFDLGEDWRRTLTGDVPDWDDLYRGYLAAVDWPTSLLWHELCEVYPRALVVLSVRESARVWWESLNATVLPVVRVAGQEGRDLVTLFECFTGTSYWDDRSTLMAAYERHNDAVRRAIAPHRLLEWNVCEGWRPICRALGVPVPDAPFPWVNRREEWA